eukprot:scaffold209589_cov35-Tisochrysis_lutea.AAC.2
MRSVVVVLPEGGGVGSTSCTGLGGCGSRRRSAGRLRRGNWGPLTRVQTRRDVWEGGEQKCGKGPEHRGVRFHDAAQRKSGSEYGG